MLKGVREALCSLLMHHTWTYVLPIYDYLVLSVLCIERSIPQLVLGFLLQQGQASYLQLAKDIIHLET